MKLNDFKRNLKVAENIITPISSESNTSDSILEDLGLLNLPENIEVSISDDNKYLNIKLKDTEEEKHLLFQLFLNQPDYSALKDRNDYQELLDRYNSYMNVYVDQIKDYAVKESIFLHEKFPDLAFTIKLRVKSHASYISKLNKNILNGKSPYINDIAAERILISSYKNSQDENILRDMCDKVAKALYDFRINTTFRMKENIEPNKSNSSKEYLTKDYMENPKDNGYESLHIVMQDKYNSDLTYETQIRTLEMEGSLKNSNVNGHSSYKPRLLNDLSPNKVPSYIEITSLYDDNGDPTVYSASLEERFYHFYNSDLHDYNCQKEPIITYKKFREEQYEIENLLGMQLNEIRQKIRALNLKNKEVQKDEEIR